jgi:hypothetical protein
VVWTDAGREDENPPAFPAARIWWADRLPAALNSADRRVYILA